LHPYYLLIAAVWWQ